jgi:hypothetical protein
LLPCTKVWALLRYKLILSSRFFFSIADISETQEEASCSHSQGSEINSQTQSFDPVSYIGKPLNDTRKKQFLVLNGHQKKDNIHFPLQTIEYIM